MIEIVISCLIYPFLLTIDTVDTYKECLTTKSKIEYVVQWHETVSNYFKTEEDILRALGIIYCESRGKPTAIGINSNGTKDVGLWQFNDDTWEWLKPKLKINNSRKNPQVATAVASWLVYNDGWYHWNSSKWCWKGTDNELLRKNIKLLQDN
tara:strand:- start:334 stop:789 length:456 start_codon:yes stop_codon:yes gene_type:complete